MGWSRRGAAAGAGSAARTNTLSASVQMLTERHSMDSVSSAATGTTDAAASSDMGTVHGGESPIKSMEGCMRGGRRRSSSQLVSRGSSTCGRVKFTVV